MFGFSDYFTDKKVNTGYEKGTEEIRDYLSLLDMLLEHYLDGDFDPVFPELVAALRSEEYYVNMMIAWYFATALAKQYAQIVPYIENRRLDAWTHNKAIQKAVESRRITPEQKAYLKTLKIRKG